MAFLISFLFLANSASAYTAIKRGVAHGTFMLQGYSGLETPGTLTFYNLGSMAEESSLSYVDDAFISTDEKGYYDYVTLKGKFSGGPNGVATFTTAEDFTFSVPLKDGRIFELSIPGVQVHMTVSDPSIFVSEDEYVPEEYDPDAPLEDSGVKISHRNGQVEIACPPDFDSWDVLKPGRIIYAHCHIKTAEDSTVNLDFPDMTTFKMRPETEIVIDAIPKQSKIGLLFGGIWANVKKMAKDGTMEVHGSQAVAGIKGTTFIMEENEAGTKLKVIEGVVAFTAKANNESRDIAAGQEVTAAIGRLGETVKFDIEADNALWAMPAANNEMKTDEAVAKTTGTTKTKFIIGGPIAALLIIVISVLVIKKK